MQSLEGKTKRTERKEKKHEQKEVQTPTAQRSSCYVDGSWNDTGK